MNMEPQNAGVSHYLSFSEHFFGQFSHFRAPNGCEARAAGDDTEIGEAHECRRPWVMAPAIIESFSSHEDLTGGKNKLAFCDF